MSRIGVLVPTRDRPEELRGLIASLRATSTRADALVYVDDDQRDLYLDIEQKEMLSCDGRVIFHHGSRVGPVASFNALVSANPGYSVYGAATDDSRFLTTGWDKWVVETARGFTGGIGAISPHLPGIRYMSFPYLTRRWIAVCGWFAYPPAYHFCWDTIIELIAEPVGLVYAPADEFSVSHPNHTSSNLPGHFERDARSFLFWAIRERRDIIERLKKVQGVLP